MKNLCLDIGNVLCHVKFNDFINLLSYKLNLSNDEVWDFLNRVQKLHDVGLTNLKDELKDHFKIKSNEIVKEILNSWDLVLIPNDQVINAIKKIQSELKIEIALLSNIGFEHADLFNSQVQIDNSIKHFSCYVGARKPTLLYYQSFLQQYPQFNNAIYLDDNLDNLASGKKMGLDSIYFNLEEKFTQSEFKLLTSEQADILLADKVSSLIMNAMKG